MISPRDPHALRFAEITHERVYLLQTVPSGLLQLVVKMLSGRVDYLLKMALSLVAGVHVRLLDHYRCRVGLLCSFHTHIDSCTFLPCASPFCETAQLPARRAAAEIYRDSFYGRS